MTSSKPTIAIPAWRVVSEVLLRMQLDIDHDWTVDEAARVAGYEPHHFATLFTQTVGHPPARYVRMLRLERAADALFSIE